MPKLGAGENFESFDESLNKTFTGFKWLWHILLETLSAKIATDKKK